MLDLFAGSWLTIVVRGLAAMLFGLAALVVPQLTLDGLRVLFAVYALADGALALVAAARVRRRDAPAGRLALTEGAGAVAIGALALVWPGLTLLALLLLIAVRALVTGAVLAAGAVHLRRDPADARLVGAAGLVSLAFGIALVAFPAAGVLGLVWWIALFAILVGAGLIALGVRARRAGVNDRAYAAAV